MGRLHDKLVMRQKLQFGVILLAVLGSQLGIAVIVTEWRSPDSETIIQQETLRESGPSKAELSTRKCEAALDAAGAALSRATTGGTLERITFRAPPPTIPDSIKDLIDRYC